MANTEYADLSKPDIDDPIGLTIPSLAENFSKLDVLLKSHSDNITTLTNQVESLVDPIELGAVGDGVADDTLAIQAWLDLPGKNRILKDGKYRITSGLISNEHGRTIKTEGASIIADGNDIIALTVKGNNNRISVEVDGKDKAAVGVLVLDASFCEVTNCRIENFYPKNRGSIGIEAYTSGGVFISNNIIRNINSKTNSTFGDSMGASRAISVHSESQAINLNTVTNNYIDTIIGEEGDGIHFLFYDKVNTLFLKSKGIIKGNTLKNCNRRYIKIQASNCKISDNTITHTLPQEETNMSSGINVINSEDVIIQNNTLDAPYYVGIMIYGQSDMKTKRVQILNNTIKGGLVDGTAIYFEYFDNGVIKENIIYDGVMSIAGGQSTNLVINNNTLYGGGNTSTHIGINILSSCSTIVIKDNVALNGQRWFMIRNGAPNSIIESNHSKTGNGIEILPSATKSYYKNNTSSGTIVITGTATDHYLDDNRNNV